MCLLIIITSKNNIFLENLQFDLKIVYGCQVNMRNFWREEIKSELYKHIVNDSCDKKFLLIKLANHKNNIRRCYDNYHKLYVLNFGKQKFISICYLFSYLRIGCSDKKGNIRFVTSFVSVGRSLFKLFFFYVPHSKSQSFVEKLFINKV